MSYPGVRSFWVFADYQANRAELTSSSCENVETDKSCQATCHLVKEIKKEESEQEGMANLPLEVLKIECLFAGQEDESDLTFSDHSNAVLHYSESWKLERYHSIFHPPEDSFLQV